MNVLFENPEKVYVKLIFRDKPVWVAREDFESAARFRAGRIANGQRYNTGPMVVDEFADRGEALVEGGRIGPRELMIVMDAETYHRFPEGTFNPLPGESRPNESW